VPHGIDLQLKQLHNAGMSFLTAAGIPFMLAIMLLIAWPFKWAIKKYMKDGWLKRLLLFSW